ncbi:MAG: DUF2817 domain-containing protein [Methylacidiphilales bacterium]|nr:DUF2817 domain-containing protein [Candidatus Methylacidiphilales bacterium]
MFSHTYLQARNKFLSLAKKHNAEITTYPHPLRGAENETLATDVAILGKGPCAIMTVSATHGVEGFYGSAVQSMLMQDPHFKNQTIRFIHVHAINPWGFSHIRRYNENNIDINRNFWDTPPLTFNKPYAKVHPWMCLKNLTRAELDRAAKVKNKLEKRYSIDQLKVALFGGQTTHPEGLQFAGYGHSWSRLCFENILTSTLEGVTSLLYCDLHTGLGPSGYPDILSTYEPGSKKQKLMIKLFGPIANLDDKNLATGQRVTNETNSAVDSYCALKRSMSCITLALECGTVSVEEMLEALRIEHAAWFGSCSKKQFLHAKNKLKNAFYPNTSIWKKQALTLSKERFELFCKIVKTL